MVHLDADLELGSVRRNYSTLECSDEQVQDREETISSNAPVKPEASPASRIEMLLRILCHPLEKLSAEENEQLNTLIVELSDVFALDDTELGCTQLVKHSINTRDNAPIQQQPYRTPVVRREQLDEMVAEIQGQGIVKPSSSPWASPIVLVPKKDGSLRFGIDYGCLNAVTCKDKRLSSPSRGRHPGHPWRSEVLHFTRSCVRVLGNCS